jgi:hypothetical protein
MIMGNSASALLIKVVFNMFIIGKNCQYQTHGTREKKISNQRKN